jgi:hypothetical protein
MKNILLGQSSATPWCLDIGLVIEATVMNNNICLWNCQGVYIWGLDLLSKKEEY